MQRNYLVAIVFSIAILIVGFACESKASAAEETEVLKITVGEPTKLSDLVNQNTASLSVSRTGVVAAFYPKPGTGPKFYRTSTDGGVTWEKDPTNPQPVELTTPGQLGSVGAQVVGSRIHLWIGDNYDGASGIGYFYYEPEIELHEEEAAVED